MPLEQELYAERQMNQLLRESYADLEALYRDDVGWQKLGVERPGSPDGRRASPRSPTSPSPATR
jgi:hypothetical protein